MTEEELIEKMTEITPGIEDDYFEQLFALVASWAFEEAAKMTEAKKSWLESLDAMKFAEEEMAELVNDFRTRAASIREGRE